MPFSYTLVGKRIKAARKKAGLTQSVLAEKLDISIVHLSKLENGVYHISLHMLAQICDITDTRIEWMVGGGYTPKTAAYNWQFGEIAKDCSAKVVETMLSVCEQIAEVAKDKQSSQKDT